MRVPTAKEIPGHTDRAKGVIYTVSMFKYSWTKVLHTHVSAPRKDWIKSEQSKYRQKKHHDMTDIVCALAKKRHRKKYKQGKNM